MIQAVNETGGDSLHYRDAGVDIDRGEQLVARIKPIAERTQRTGVLGGIGGFGSLFELPRERYRRPVLVSGTDGVGTKLRIAIEAGIHEGIGTDLVAMCVNDVLTLGAEPLYFLDYFATGQLDLDVAESVLRGIGRGCELAGAALAGGETAEMPGMYAAHDYDLAGFCVGVVEHDEIIDGSRVRPGHALVGIASSGAHANGFSLIRKVMERTGTGVDAPFDGRTLGEVLLVPTRIYVKSVHELLRRAPVHAMAHITGGGILENLPRVLPAGTLARVDTRAWPRPPLFDWIQRGGNVPASEMHRTFNCGIGMVLAVPSEAGDAAVTALGEQGESAWVIGSIERSAASEPHVVLE